MRRSAIALAALAALLVIVIRIRGDAPRPSAPASPRSSVLVPEESGGGGTDLAPLPEILPSVATDGRATVTESGDGPWLVVEVDPAITPVSTPAAALVDADGRVALDLVSAAPVSLAGLSEGAYTLVPRGPGWRVEPETLVLDTEPGDHAALFVPENVYAGRVVDRATQAPVAWARAGAAHQETGDAGLLVVTLDRLAQDGAFRFGGVPASRGRVRFTFDAEGYLPGSTEWLDAGPDTVHADLVIELTPDDAPRAVLALHVVDGGTAGEPVAARVIVHRLEGFRITGLFGAGRDVEPLVEGTLEGEPPGSEVVETDGGRAELALRAPGRYQFVVASDAHAPFLSEAFEVLPAERIEREVVLERGARLEGRVIVQAGDASIPAPRSVHVSGPRAMGLELDDSGTFAAGGLPDGDYLARVLAGNGVVVRAEPFAVRDGRDVALVVRCGSAREGSTLEGELVLPLEARDFTCQIGATAGPTLSDAAFVTAADEAGRFAIHGLPAGEVFVAVVGKPHGQEHDAAPARRVVTWATVPTDGTTRSSTRLDASTTRVSVHLAAARLPPETGELECALTRTDGDPRARALLPEATRMFLAPGREYAFLGLPAGEYVLEGPGVRSVAFAATGATAVAVEPE